ncbi:peroxisome biogenesis factor 1-like [Anneissia japonica]|uniref:peroxisome biogenesis factor 1-like n=1 Tax=Anneissia japonica TaxID=1529436 RepID=UPI0014256706|nr:peroxisome biogenesis factor 1-like [Anneissia japonica]
MTGAMIAVVEFSPMKNCFISLPASWAKDLSQVQFPTFQLEWGDSNKAYVSWAGDITRHSDSRDTEVIQLNGLYGNKLGLLHGQEVLVQSVQPVLPCSQAAVEPASFDDWEILELNASYVETNLLSQVRVIWPNQVLPVWIGKKICIFIKISSIEPDEKCIRLEPYTELAIIPKARSTSSHSTSPHTPIASSTDRVTASSGLSFSTDFNIPKTVGEGSWPLANTESPSSLASIDESMTSGYVSDYKSTRNFPHYRGQVSEASENVDMNEEDPITDQEQDSSLPWAYRLWTYIKSFVFTEDSGESAIEQGKLSLDKERQKAIATELLKDCNIVARVHPLVESYEKSVSNSKRMEGNETEVTENSYSHLMQPTTVYLSSSAEGALIDLPIDPSRQNSLPIQEYVSFYAIITKLKSPKERQEELRQRQNSNSTKISKTNREKTLKTTDDVNVEGVNKGEEEPISKLPGINTDYAAVRVVINSQDIQIRQRSSGEVSPYMVLDDASPWTLQISDLLRRQLRLAVTAKVLIRPITESPSVMQAMTLYPLYRVQSELTPAVIEGAFHQWLSCVSCMIWPIPICGGSSLLKFPVPGCDGDQEEFVLTINAEQNNSEAKQQTYFLLHPFIAKKVKCAVCEVALCDTMASLPPRTTSQIDPVVAGFRLRDLGGVSELGQSGLNHIKTSLAIRPLSRQVCSGLPGLLQGGLIITGPKGSGKTTLAMALCREVMSWPQLVYVNVLECKPLKGKRVESVRRRLEEAFNEAAWRQPSLILLDDLDQLTGAPLGPEQEIGPDALYSMRLAEVLKDLMSAEIRQGTRVCVLATCLTKTSLHQGLTSSRGTHFFQHWIDIQPMDTTKREEMLSSMIQSKMEIDLQSLDELDLSVLAMKTEGFVARDLMTVLERAIHAACSREMVNGSWPNKANQDSSNENNGIILIEEDFECAIKNYTPATLRDVPLHNAGELGWKNVGGLTEVKKTLIETLLWPAKYPQLFKNCPLRLRSGLLLYGPPGTGKTLLGGAVAKECGLNFISIKGPELLSKYIGASEQSIRDLFRRAQSAKPCILFFDEFDALAPRRGHDSTGVTDRVVNQLLTQLDGVEGLDGVYVIGATSRPDLIDPALLRPGRLDKCLNCPIPNKTDQRDILHALSMNMTLDDDINFDNIIEHCKFFTGADLKALLYNAQLDAIHSQIAPSTKQLSSERLSPLHMKSCRSMEADEWKLTFLDSASFDDGITLQNRAAISKSQVRKASVPSDPDVALNPVVESSGSDSDSASFIRLSQSEEEYSNYGNSGKGTPPGKHTPSLRDIAALRLERSPPLVEVEDMLENIDEDLFDLQGLYPERKQEQRLIYMPTLRDGIVDICAETQERIANQVALIRKNHLEKMSGYLGGNKEENNDAPESHVVKISQSNLVKAVNSMKPSVSAKERQRYQQIYESFVNSRGGNFTGQEGITGKRATLA